jgi:signal peptidase I
VVLGLATHLLPAWDAGRIARRGVSYRVRGYNRPVIYVALLLVSIFVWNPAYRSFIQARIGRAYLIPSAAMEPTIMLDDYIMSSPRRWPIARGDIVILRAGGVTITKRAVGLPGDTIAMLDGRLRIGTVMSPEPYATRDSTDPAYPELGWQKSHLAGGVDSASYQPSLHNWGPLVVPTNHYFVLGDNRSNSLDSREFGFISRDSIVGRPMTVYFSRDTSTHTIRWERIGRSLSR